MRKILITSALPYVNNVPHLGNIIGCVLSADVFARYNRLMERDIIYVCGTDEYGTATEAKALEEKVSPREICNKYNKIHRQIYDWFNISFDIFGRTSDEVHTKIVQEIFLDLYNNNMLVEKLIEQPYDAKLGMFLADRFVIGECPHCHSLDARADQCDKCNKLLNFSDLINPKSKLSGTTPQLRESRHLLIDLPKIQPVIEQWIDGVEKSGRWSQNTIAIAKGWLAEGLEQRSITRDLKWGVKVPIAGWEDKVLYVWFDAPIGYISITSSLRKDYMSWWGGDEKVEHYEFIGKDNVPFHAIIFPATLMGTGRKWTYPHYISSTEFLNYEDGKFSKSRGVGVFGNDAIDIAHDEKVKCDTCGQRELIDADSWRYYLIANRPETSDTTFSWDDFGKKHNNELLANFGNFVNRTLVFAKNNCEGIVPQAEILPEDREFLDAQRIRILKMQELLEGVKLRAAIAEMMSISSAANAYFQENKPWSLTKEDSTRMGTVMNVLLNQVYDLAILCEPFLPNTSKRIFAQLNCQSAKWKSAGEMKLKEGHALGKPEHLFHPIDKSVLDRLKKKYCGKQADLENKEQGDKKKGEKTKSNTDIKKDLKTAEPIKHLGLENLELEVGLIESVEKHPNADKLFVEKILLKGGEMRTVCSGLVGHFSSDEIMGKSCVIVKNLKPANLRGVESAGMLLVAHAPDGTMEIISPQAVAGTPILFEGVKRAKEMREILIDEFFTIELVARGAEIFADGHKLSADGKPIKLEKVKEGGVS
ncbi:MAG: methionine--tRNA ligase [Candidatus Micrarchaeia archaeon]